MRQAIQKNALILSAFAIACTALVGGVHLLTKDTIKLQEQQYLLNTLNQVIPPLSMIMICTKTVSGLLAAKVMTLSNLPT